MTTLEEWGTAGQPGAEPSIPTIKNDPSWNAWKMHRDDLRTANLAV
jgi:hypothetical protein